MDCINPEHRDAATDDTCAACYSRLDAELTRQRDLYMQLLTENGELRRKVREAEREGRITPLPVNTREGTAANAAGFEAVQGTDVLQLGGRTTPPTEDLVVAGIFHRTTGTGRSILLRRQAVEALHEWTAKWLALGWPDVPRECGRFHRPAQLHEWRCDQPPGHKTDHEGPATGWPGADGGKPGRRNWDDTGAETWPEMRRYE